MDERRTISNLLESETYQMLIDLETELCKVSLLIIFYMWEVEKTSGDSSLSFHIRPEAYKQEE